MKEGIVRKAFLSLMNGIRLTSPQVNMNNFGLANACSTHSCTVNRHLERMEGLEGQALNILPNLLGHPDCSQTLFSRTSH